MDSATVPLAACTSPSWQEISVAATHGWMDVQTDGQVPGWKDGWMDGGMDEGWMAVDGRIAGWMDHGWDASDGMDEYTTIGSMDRL